MRSIKISYSSIRERIEALPEPERSARRLLYSDYAWEHAWELNAWPHQIPPIGDDWTSWTVLGSRAQGKTTAGFKWMEQKLIPRSEKTMLVVLGYRKDMPRISAMFSSSITEAGLATDFTFNKKHTGDRFESLSPKCILDIVPAPASDGYWQFPRTNYDYIWADEISDATILMQTFPLTKQFVFTQPTKLPKQTILSLARD